MNACTYNKTDCDATTDHVPQPTSQYLTGFALFKSTVLKTSLGERRKGRSPTLKNKKAGIKFQTNMQMFLIHHHEFHTFF